MKFPLRRTDDIAAVAVERVPVAGKRQEGEIRGPRPGPVTTLLR
jgi:hypothetical protein